MYFCVLLSFSGKIEKEKMASKVILWSDEE